MRAEQVIVNIIVEMAEKNLQIGYIKDISKYIYDCKQRGRDVADITLQRTPLGFYSPEVAEFLGKLVTAGLATQENPLIVTENNINWLKKNLLK